MTYLTNCMDCMCLNVPTYQTTYLPNYLRFLLNELHFYNLLDDFLENKTKLK